MSYVREDIYSDTSLESSLTEDEILEIFDGDAFDNDVWLKIDYILSNTDEYSQRELLDLYDNY